MIIFAKIVTTAFLFYAMSFNRSKIGKPREPLTEEAVTFDIFFWLFIIFLLWI
mgnify:CR=1 FL=1